MAFAWALEPTTTVERRYPVGGDGRSMTGGSVSNVSIPSIDRIGHMKVAHQAVTFLLSQDRRRCDADAGCIALNDRTHRPPGIHGRDEVVPSVEEDAAQGPSITDRLHRLRGALTERLRDADFVYSLGWYVHHGSVDRPRTDGRARVLTSLLAQGLRVSDVRRWRSAGSIHSHRTDGHRTGERSPADLVDADHHTCPRRRQQ